MMIPHTARIGGLVLASTAFYTYVGQMVPQKEVLPPQETVIRSDLTTTEMVTVGREIMEGKGLCMTCHTIGRTGALRFPDLDGIAARATSRVEGLNDVEYFAQSMYVPDAYIVPGFNPGMPVINKPPIGLSDQEILCVIAYLQTLGGTATVTLQTSHRYFVPPATPGGEAPPPAEPGEKLPLTAPPAPGNNAPGGPKPPVPPASTPPRKERAAGTPAKGANLTPAVPPPHMVTRRGQDRTTEGPRRVTGDAVTRVLQTPRIPKWLLRKITESSGFVAR